MNLSFIQTKNDFKFDLFIWLEYAKFFLSVTLLIIFSFIIDEPGYDYVINLNYVNIVTTLLALLSVKFLDPQLKYTHYVAILLDYAICIAAIILSRNPYSTLFYWLATDLIVTYYITNSRFTTLIMCILLAFLASWPTFFWSGEELNYSIYADSYFQVA